MCEDVVHIWLHTIGCASLPVHLCSMHETMYENMYGTVHGRISETMYETMCETMYVDVLYVCCHALCCVRP